MESGGQFTPKRVVSLHWKVVVNLTVFSISLTQLISDGLWIIYLLLPLYITTIFIIPFIFTEKEFFLQRFDPLDKQNNFKRSRAIISNLIVLIFVYGVCFNFILLNTWPYASVLTLWYSFIVARVNFLLYKKYNKEEVFFIFEQSLYWLNFLVFHYP